MNEENNNLNKINFGFFDDPAMDNELILDNDMSEFDKITIF